VVYSGSVDNSGARAHVKHDPDRNLDLVALETECMNVFNGHTKGVTALVFTEEENTLASGSKDRSIRLWAPDSGLQGTRTP